MTELLLILGFVALAAIGAAITLRRLYRPRSPVAAEAMESELLNPSRLVPEAYQPMSRLFAEEDFQFLARVRPALRKRLRRQRQQVLRLYLGQIRTEFERLYALCRQLALVSRDPNFPALITQEFLAFYGLLLVLHVRCTLGWFLHVRVDTVDLVGALERLRQAAQAAVSLQPELAGNLA